MPKKYALVIGNTEYIDPGLAKLNAPGRDAEDFARVLQLAEMAAFDEVVTLVNENVPKLNEAIEDFFADKKPDDLLVFYFSGHGVRDDEGSLFLAVKSTRKARLHSTAITAEFVRKLMDKSRSTRQVIILDCCNSGAFPQGTVKGDNTMGMAGSLQGYGRVVLTATDKLQYAWEGNTLLETDKSLFTHFLVKGLEGEADRDADGKITVDELYDYAFDKVREATPNQTPTKSATGQKGEIILREGIKKEVKPTPLPAELITAIESPFARVREGAVGELESYLQGKNTDLAFSAKEALKRIAKDDDSRRVSQLAAQAIALTGKIENQTKESSKPEEPNTPALQKVKQEVPEEISRMKQITSATSSVEEIQHKAAEISSKAKKTNFNQLRFPPPIAQVMTTFLLGDDLYDESFAINTKAGEFLGEFGIGISEIVGVGEPRKVSALEIWLFDKNGIKTQTKVLSSKYAFDDPTTRTRLGLKGELVQIEPQARLLLETATLQLLATVVDFQYVKESPSDSYFEHITLELAIWPRVSNTAVPADPIFKSEKAIIDKLRGLPPIKQNKTTFLFGDDLYDESFVIDTKAGEFLGEFGIGIAETVGVGEPRKVSALEIWLFDKNDIKTPTKILTSKYAFSDPVTRARLGLKGELVQIEPQARLLLETATLQLLATVINFEYARDPLQINSYFKRIMLDLAIWPRK